MRAIAHEQEVYFAIGGLTEVSRRSGNESLAEMLYPTRWIRRGKKLAARVLCRAQPFRLRVPEVAGKER